MSIKDEIERLNNAKTDMRNALENKGISVPSSETIDKYAEHINNIKVGMDGLFEIPISIQSLMASQLSAEELKYINDNIETIKKGAYINVEGNQYATVMSVLPDRIYAQSGYIILILYLESGNTWSWTLPIAEDVNIGKIPQVNEDGTGWKYIDPSELGGEASKTSAPELHLTANVDISNEYELLESGKQKINKFIAENNFPAAISLFIDLDGIPFVITCLGFYASVEELGLNVFSISGAMDGPYRGFSIVITNLYGDTKLTFEASSADIRLPLPSEENEGKVVGIGVNGFNAIELSKVSGYDLVITTQDEFEDWYKALDERTFTGRSVLIVGNRNVYRRGDGKGLHLPSTLYTVHGVGGPCIVISNFNRSYEEFSGETNYGAIWYDKLAISKGGAPKYEIRNIRVEITASSQSVGCTAFACCANVYNCYALNEASSFGGGAFYNCRNVIDSVVYHKSNTNGFDSCDGLVNCYADGGWGDDVGRAYINCKRLVNCGASVSSFAKYAIFQDCDIISNCASTESTKYTMLNCTHVDKDTCDTDEPELS